MHNESNQSNHQRVASPQCFDGCFTGASCCGLLFGQGKANTGLRQTPTPAHCSNQLIRSIGHSIITATTQTKMLCERDALSSNQLTGVP